MGIEPPARGRYDGLLGTPRRFNLENLSPALTKAIEVEGLKPSDFEGWLSRERSFDWEELEKLQCNGNELHTAVDPDSEISVAIYISADVPTFPARWSFSEHPLVTTLFWACEFHYLSPGPDLPEEQASGASSEINQRPDGATLQ